MATNAIISYMVSKDSFISSYVHYDGYFSYMAEMLTKHYHDVEKVKELFQLGDMVQLDKFCHHVEGHTFETPIKDHTVFYRRDCGEDIETRYHFSVSAIKGKYSHVYHYFYIFGEWCQIIKYRDTMNDIITITIFPIVERLNIEHFEDIPVKEYSLSFLKYNHNRKLLIHPRLYEAFDVMVNGEFDKNGYIPNKKTFIESFL